jgi:hypothetical protein
MRRITNLEKAYSVTEVYAKRNPHDRFPGSSQ